MSVTLTVGTTYSFAGYSWLCAEVFSNYAVLQSISVTTGKWPGYVMSKFGGSANTAYASDIDGEDISDYNETITTLYNNIKDAEYTSATYGEGLYLVSNDMAKSSDYVSAFSASAIANNKNTYNGTYKLVSGVDRGFSITSEGVNKSIAQTTVANVCPAFNVDLSKIELSGTTITVAVESSNFPIKFLTESKLQYLLNYIARDLGLVDSGKNKTFINGEWVHCPLEFTDPDESYTHHGEIYDKNFYIVNKIKNNNIGYFPLFTGVCLYKNKIHAFGAYFYNSCAWGACHFVGDFRNWEIINPAPFAPCGQSYYKAISYNNKVYLFNTNAYSVDFFSWNGLYYEQYAAPVQNIFYEAEILVYNNKIYALSSYNSNAQKTIYAFDGTNWTLEKTIDVSLGNTTGAMVYNGKIHIFNGSSHYTYDGTNFTQISNNPISFSNPFGIEYKGNLILCSYGSNYNVFYTYNGTTWTKKTNWSANNTNSKIFANNNYSRYGDFIIFNNKLYLAGVYAQTIINGKNVLNGYIYYDDATDSWKTDTYIEDKGLLMKGDAE